MDNKRYKGVYVNANREDIHLNIKVMNKRLSNMLFSLVVIHDKDTKKVL